MPYHGYWIKSDTGKHAVFTHKKELVREFDSKESAKEAIDELWKLRKEFR